MEPKETPARTFSSRPARQCSAILSKRSSRSITGVFSVIWIRMSPSKQCRPRRGSLAHHRRDCCDLVNRIVQLQQHINTGQHILCRRLLRRLRWILTLHTIMWLRTLSRRTEP